MCSTAHLVILCCFVQSAGLPNFAWGHECSRQDTLSGLAVKYGVSNLAIRMTNNLISDQGLQSRDVVYVPGQHNTILLAIQYCAVPSWMNSMLLLALCGSMLIGFCTLYKPT